MKAVAPAVAPDLSYGDLDIADGGDASAAFYRIVADSGGWPLKLEMSCGSFVEYCNATPWHWRGCTSGQPPGVRDDPVERRRCVAAIRDIEIAIGKVRRDCRRDRLHGVRALEIRMCDVILHHPQKVNDPIKQCD